MIFELFETTSGPGLIAKIEAQYEWDGYNHLLAELSAFCSRKRYQLQERSYEQYRMKKHQKTWQLPIVKDTGESGVINILSLGDTYQHKLGRGWTSQKFLIYFNFSDESVGLAIRAAFKEKR